MECPICFCIYNLEKNQAVKLQCSHTLCKYCIDFSKKPDNTFSCPQCFKVTKYADSIEVCETIRRILMAKSRNLEIDQRENQSFDDMILILIRSMNNRSFEIKINRNETVKRLKDLVKEVEGVEPKAQWLLYNGIALDDEKKLKEYNIMNGHIVSLVFRSLGG